MPETLELTLEDQMTRYLAEEMSLESFQEWFVPFFLNLPDVEHGSQMAPSVELLLAEYTGGHLTEEQLSAEFRNLARTISLQVGAFSSRTGSSSVTRSLTIPIGHIPAVRWGW